MMADLRFQMQKWQKSAFVETFTVYYRDKFKEYVRAVEGVRELTPHSCRHTYVSQMQALGVDLATIQSMVGHADLDMTQHYLHVQSPVKQKAVDVFDQAFCSKNRIPVRFQSGHNGEHKWAEKIPNFLRN